MAKIENENALATVMQINLDDESLIISAMSDFKCAKITVDSLFETYDVCSCFDDPGDRAQMLLKAMADFESYMTIINDYVNKLGDKIKELEINNKQCRRIINKETNKA